MEIGLGKRGAGQTRKEIVGCAPARTGLVEAAAGKRIAAGLRRGVEHAATGASHLRIVRVDLDIDVLVESDFSYQILDLEDFEAYRYPEAVKQRAREALDELVTLVETRSFPFNE